MHNMVQVSVSKLALGTALLALGHGAAWAQDAAGADEGASATASARQGNAIVVTGERLRIQQALDAKRNSEVIGDFLAADDLGVLPDYNIADAIRRVPGVNTIFDEDEGRYLSLRGMDADFTYVTWNGGPIATLDLGGDFGGGRRVMMETIPSPAVKRLEILKSVRADRDGQGIGGQVNVITKSAFDYNGLYLSGNASLGYYASDNVPTSDKQPSYRANLTIASTFGPDDQFGILLAGAYRKKVRDQDRVNPGGWRYYTDDLVRNTAPEVGQSDLNPWAVSLISHGYSNKVEHLGGLAKLEYRPDPSVEISLESSYWEQVDNEERPDLLFNGGSITGIGSDGSISVDNATISHRLQTWYIKKYVWSNQLSLDWDLNERTSLALRGTYSKSNWYEDAPRSEFRETAIDYVQYPGDRNTPPVNVVTSADVGRFLDPANYEFHDLQHRFDDENEEVYEISADFKYDFQDSVPGLGLGLGGKWREIDKSFDRDVFRWEDGTTTLTVDQVLRADLANTPYIPPASNYSVVFIDEALFFDAFNAATASDPYNTSTSQEIFFNQSFTEDQNRRQDFAVDEKVGALYGILTHEGDRHEVYAGLRAEHTNSLATAQLVDGPTGTFGTVERKSSYWSYLPSAGIRYDLTSQVRTRLAFSKTIGRPSFRDLAATRSVSFNESTGTTTINDGNPDLRPDLPPRKWSILRVREPAIYGLKGAAEWHGRDTRQNRLSGCCVRPKFGSRKERRSARSAGRWGSRSRAIIAGDVSMAG